DEHQGSSRALVSAEFANDLDRGAYNLIARYPNRAQFFHGADTFVLPADADTFVVDTRNGPIAPSLRAEFLTSTPVYETRLANGQSQVTIYKLTAQELEQL